MKYTIEFELPDNETVKRQIKYCPVHWQIWGYCGDTIAKPKADRKTENSSEKPNNCKAQMDYDKGLQLFADILFDKEKSEQFLKECKTMGIEP